MLAAVYTEDHAICSIRRGLLFAPFLAALPLELLGGTARAGQIDPAETAITLSDAIKWNAWRERPPHSGEVATLYGGLDRAGPYLVLMKWNPGYMSAPHSYATDRLSLVLSGTWWVNSGADFDPDQTVPVAAGGFVRRRSHAALRRCEARRKAASLDRVIRNRAGRADAGGPRQARLAAGLISASFARRHGVSRHSTLHIVAPLIAAASRPFKSKNITSQRDRLSLSTLTVLRSQESPHADLTPTAGERSPLLTSALVSNAVTCASNAWISAGDRLPIKAIIGASTGSAEPSGSPIGADG